MALLKTSHRKLRSPEPPYGVLDDVRDRFGTTAITRAVLLHRDQGVVMPLLPD